MQTCYDLVWLSAQRAPSDLAIIDDQSERALTYQQLIEEVDVVAAGLQARGVTQGMRIATVLPSLFDHAIVLLALQRLAAIPALMNFRLQHEEITELIKIGEIEGAIIYLTRLWRKLSLKHWVIRIACSVLGVRLVQLKIMLIAEVISRVLCPFRSPIAKTSLLFFTRRARPACPKGLSSPTGQPSTAYYGSPPKPAFVTAIITELWVSCP